MADKIDDETNEAEVPPIVIYTSSYITCPYCIRAKQVLTERGYSFDERDIANPRFKAELLEKRPTARTVPQIFLRSGYHIGGCDDLVRIVNNLDTIIELNS